MPSDLTAQLLELNQKLLNAIFAGDWKTYSTLCDERVTCFEPEALGHLIEGLPFHKYYFDLPGGGSGPVQVSMATPVVKPLGTEAALVLYTRLVQVLTPTGPMTKRVEETRVWQNFGGTWKLIHVHRSAPA